jgi:hypothetical protein
MVTIKARYEGVFEKAQKAELGEILKAGELLGKIATHQPGHGLQEIYFRFSCRIIFILDGLIEIKKGDKLAQLKIIPD